MQVQGKETYSINSDLETIRVLRGVSTLERPSTSPRFDGCILVGSECTSYSSGRYIQNFLSPEIFTKGMERDQSYPLTKTRNGRLPHPKTYRPTSIIVWYIKVHKSCSNRKLTTISQSKCTTGWSTDRVVGWIEKLLDRKESITVREWIPEILSNRG